MTFLKRAIAEILIGANLLSETGGSVLTFHKRFSFHIKDKTETIPALFYYHLFFNVNISLMLVINLLRFF